MSDTHTGSLIIDAPEGYIEAEATFTIAACWSRRNSRGYRTVDYVSDAELESWIFNGRKQTRETAVALMGEDAVQQSEQFSVEEWRETATQNDADEYGDWKYEQRRDIAAE